MKTIQVDRHGNADVLKLTEIETPKPQTGNALVKRQIGFEKRSSTGSQRAVGGNQQDLP
jgi:hypothetical protein